MRKTVAFAKRMSQKQTARNASWMVLGQGGNFLLQAGYFVLLARLLGVTQYGIFAGAYALVNIVSPYASLGGGMLFMRYVIPDRPSAPVYWGNSLLAISMASVLLGAVLWVLGPTLTGIHSREMFLVLTLGNCFFAQVSSVASQVFQAYEKLRLTAAISFSSNLGRFLILLVMLLTLHRATAIQWSVGVMIASGIAAVVSIVLVQRQVLGITYSWQLLRSRLVEGFGFSFAGTTQAVYTDIDKTMLTHYRLDRENGFYTLAYRIVDFAATPVVALDLATIPKYFALSRARFTEVVKLAFRTVRVSLLMGVVIALGTLLFAPVIPHIVGRDFSGVLVALRWLCWIPLFRGIHRVMGSALTGTGYQSLRTGAQFFVAITNFFLNLWWIPAFGWIGAAWSSFACDLLLALLNVGILLTLLKHQSQGSDLTLESGKG